MSDSGREIEPYRNDMARCAREWANTEIWNVPKPLREHLWQIARELEHLTAQPKKAAPEFVKWVHRETGEEITHGAASLDPNVEEIRSPAPGWRWYDFAGNEWTTTGGPVWRIVR